MSETPGVTKNEGIQKLLEAEKEATKIVDEARQRKYQMKILCVILVAWCSKNFKIK